MKAGPPAEQRWQFRVDSHFGDWGDPIPYRRPVRADGSVDEEGAVAIGRHLLANGSHGLVVAGTTGEAATMTDDEHLGLLALIARELGDEATVVGGTGSNDTRHAVHLTEKAVEAGVDAVLSVTPSPATCAVGPGVAWCVSTVSGGIW